MKAAEERAREKLMQNAQLKNFLLAAKFDELVFTHNKAAGQIVKKKGREFAFDDGKSK